MACFKHQSFWISGRRFYTSTYNQVLEKLAEEDPSEERLMNAMPQLSFVLGNLREDAKENFKDIKDELTVIKEKVFIFDRIRRFVAETADDRAENVCFIINYCSKLLKKMWFLNCNNLFKHTNYREIWKLLSTFGMNSKTESMEILALKLLKLSRGQNGERMQPNASFSLAGRRFTMLFFNW